MTFMLLPLFPSLYLSVCLYIFIYHASCPHVLTNALEWSNMPSFAFKLNSDEEQEEKFFVGYHHSIAQILNISLHQSRKFVLGDSLIPDATQGASLIDNWYDGSEGNKPTSVFLWCGNSNRYDNKKCYWQIATSAQVPFKDQEVRFSEGKVADIRDVYDFKFGNWSGPQPVRVQYKIPEENKTVDDIIRGEDARVILVKGSKTPAALIVVSRHVDRLNLKQTYFGYLHLNLSTMTMYARQPLSQINIVHESGARHQKNWSPFYYRDRENNQSNWNLFFIYSSTPHRIVSVNDSIYSPDLENEDGYHFGKKVRANTQCETSNSQIQWDYGEIRGGTQAELIENIPGIGDKYLTFFHSSAHKFSPRTSTYFLGAYLFDAKPPFAITHFSREPIVDFVMYNETFGWCYKMGNPDYSIMPLSFVIRNNRTILLAWAKNVYSGRVTLLDLEGLIQDNLYQLDPHHTTVTINKLNVSESERNKVQVTITKKRRRLRKQ